MSKTWYIGNQQFTPRPNDSASEIPENIVYKNDACGAITSIVHFLSVKFAEYFFFFPSDQFLTHPKFSSKHIYANYS